jgi:hypothetical protein
VSRWEQREVLCFKVKCTGWSAEKRKTEDHFEKLYLTYLNRQSDGDGSLVCVY